jgi:phage repressor protein C with HTH and peptisase S24 domain
MIKLFKCEGNSLFPLYKDGQIVFCIKTRNPKVGDVVVFYQKMYGMMIKKIERIQDDNYYLVGTNADSIDSRNFGFIPKDDIKYKVLFKIF